MTTEPKAINRVSAAIKADDWRLAIAQCPTHAMLTATVHAMAVRFDCFHLTGMSFEEAASETSALSTDVCNLFLQATARWDAIEAGDSENARRVTVYTALDKAKDAIEETMWTPSGTPNVLSDRHRKALRRVVEELSEVSEDLVATHRAACKVNEA
jgi:hypothetical protein